MPVTLPFRKIRRIEQMLSHVPLDNLVLVFSQRQGDECLLVYNEMSVPSTYGVDLLVKRLDDLQSSDYSKFDGPVVGYSALDVVFPDIPTHGLNFYHLQHVFNTLGKQAPYEDAYQLAEWLWTHGPHLSPHLTESEQGLRRWHSKIVELALPKLLCSRRLDHLVAVLPHDNLGQYLSNQPHSLQTVYVEDLDGVNQIDPKQWIVAMEEIDLFNPQLGHQRPHFVDLRLTLRQAKQTETLRQTCLALGRCCWEKWQGSQAYDFEKAAYSLAAEAWFLNEDVEDLVAFLPHRDFEHFLDTGDAFHIYRSPRIHKGTSTAPGLSCSLGELTAGEISNESWEDYRTLALSFPVLSSIFESVILEPAVDLGPILCKAGHSPQLAHTFSLLSMDLLEEPAGFSIGIRPQVITDLALRATMIYALEEPWRKQWHSRYQQLVEQSYKYLLECLHYQKTRAVDTMLVDYYRALHEWYGCDISQDIPGSLNSIMNACRLFLEISEKRTDLQIEQDVARRLIETAKLLNTFEAKHPREPRLLPSHFDVVKYLRRVVDGAIQMHVFSLPFEDLLDAYEGCHERWQNLQNNLSTHRPSDEELRELLDAYTLLQRVAYASAHELQVLHWACQQDVERIERLRNALELGPIIQIRVLNPQVILEKRERLYVEVENIGGAIAHNFEISLGSSRRFEFTSPPEPVTRELLEIRLPYRLEWDIRPLDAPLKLHFNYRFYSNDGQLHNGEEEFPINAVPARSAGLAPHGGNPYQAGAPVVAERFFGRDNELKEILNLLLAGVTQPVLLRGPRRIGKSSILRQLEHLLTHEGEIQRIEFSVDDELALRKIRPVLTSLQEIPNMHYISRWFQAVFLAVCDSVRIEYDRKGLTDEFDQSPYHAFARHIDRLFQQRPEMRLLIMIDEWDEQRQLSELGKNLRALMQQEQRVNWIISSTWTLKEEMGRFSSPFYNQAKPIELTEMDWASATQLILNLSDKVGVDWHGDAIVALLEQTARRPYLIQFLCQEVMNHLYNRKLNLVDKETVSIAINEFIQSPQRGGHPFSFLWENVTSIRRGSGEARLHWLGRLILWTLDTKASDGLTYLEIKQAIQDELRQHRLQIPEEFFEEEFSEQMTELEYIFDAITWKRQRYTFSIPVAQRWFHHIIVPHPDPIQDGYTGMMQDYEEWKRASGKGDG